MSTCAAVLHLVQEKWFVGGRQARPAPPRAGAEPAGLDAGLTASGAGGNRSPGACPARGWGLGEHAQVMGAKAGNGDAPSGPPDDV